MTIELKDFLKNSSHINIGTIGHVDHGKSTTASAISFILSKKGLSKNVTVSDLDKTPEERKSGITINADQIEIWIPKSKIEEIKNLEDVQRLKVDLMHASIIDAPGHRDFIKNMISGAGQMDAPILVVSSVDGIQPQTVEHILLIRELITNLENFTVYINKCDLVEKEELELVELELKELLSKYSFPVEKIRFFKGSSKKVLEGDKVYESVLLNLLSHIASLKLSLKQKDKPFLQSIDRKANIIGRGNVVTGVIKSGTVKLGDLVEVLGYGRSIKTVVNGIQTFHKNLLSASVGDNVGILLKKIDGKQLQRGMVLVAIGAYKQYKSFKAVINVLTRAEGGRKSPFKVGYKPQLFLRTLDITVTLKKFFSIDTKKEIKFVSGGDVVLVEIILNSPVVLEIGLRFALREGHLTIAGGTIKELIKE